jgi:hypothetical protein
MVRQKKDVVLTDMVVYGQGKVMLSFSVIDDPKRQIRGMHF